jgi:basic membrane protein A
LAAGCGILAQHVDTTGPVVAAEEKGQFAVGYNADMSNVAPHAYLTAPVWNWGVYLTAAVQQVIDGTWKPENSLMGLKEGICDLAPLSANCAAGTQEAIDAAKAKILDGSFNVFTGPIKDNTGAEKVAAGQTLANADILGITWFVDGITVG